jgi:RimJ/RimL family protein N-acetyltransferase
MTQDNIQVKTLETERTLLRAFTEEDTPALFAITSQKRVMRYVAHPHQSIQETAQYICSGFIPHYEKHGYGRLAAIDKETQSLIGFSGLKYLDDINEVDLAYVLHPDVWGKGLATEIANACLSFASKHIRIPRVISLTTPNNHASVRVLKKIGMHYERNRLYWGEEYQQFERSNK